MWNFGDILDVVAENSSPESPAFIHDGHLTTWQHAKKRMDALARGMIGRGAVAGDKVAFYLRNGPAYGEMTGACFLASLTHANVNYRLNSKEVHYIVDNADATVLVYGAEFRSIVGEIRSRLSKVRIFIEVGEAAPARKFAEHFEELAADESTRTPLPHRSADNQVIAYTGGTTGMPKGVVFRQGDLAPYLFQISGACGLEVPANLTELGVRIRARGAAAHRYLLACPQMHSTGFWVTMWELLTGGCLITVSSRSLDPHAIWSAAAAGRATNLAIVGDAFARPLLAALDAAPGRYDLSALVGIGSSGAMWSAEVKDRLLAHLPTVTLTDVISSTEAMGVGVAVASRGHVTQTAGFTLGANTIVIDEEDRPLQPGTGIAGRLAVGGMQPLGYYKDAEKTAATFRTINGQRYSIPGDYALLEADGAVKLLGRGSNCINTAGEKVYPEEVEEALKSHPMVEDAVVVGVPDVAWGQAVTGIVRLSANAIFNEQLLKLHVRNSLSGYKVPKRIFVSRESMRGPNGKAEYKNLTAFVLREMDPDAVV